jgi:predicted Fe-Mo cluster-binding NifX family protein
MPGKKAASATDFPKIGKPAERALANAGITNMAGLSKHTEADLLALHGMGPKAMGILKAEMKAKLSFRKR